MKTGRRFVIGDIHGAHKALIQCFDRAGFDKNSDLLICLGDLGDRWPETDKVFDTLLQVKNLVLILGNHDQWMLDWFIKGVAPGIWLSQGGNMTVGAYKGKVPESHVNLLKGAVLFYELDNKLFVHGGYQPEKDIRQQEKNVLLWDRSLIKSALKHYYEEDEVQLTPYDEVYVGHTPTINFGTTNPIKACEVYLMDTGAGWPTGILSIMDIDNKTLYQSEPVDLLYTGYSG